MDEIWLDVGADAAGLDPASGPVACRHGSPGGPAMSSRSALMEALVDRFRLLDAALRRGSRSTSIPCACRRCGAHGHGAHPADAPPDGLRRAICPPPLSDAPMIQEVVITSVQRP